MPFWQGIKNGFSIARHSFGVIKKNHEVWFYPVFSIFLWLIVIGIASAITFGLYEWHIFNPASIKAIMALPKDNPRRIHFNIVATGILFLLYFFGAIIMAFTGVALTAFVIAYFNGKKITIGQSLQKASSRLGTIVAWSTVSATVGIALDMLRGDKQKQAIAQRFIGSALTMAWSILTFFVVPVIAQEQLGVFASIKRSGQIMKQTFGEYVGGTAGFSIIILMIAVVAAVTGFILNKFFGMLVGVGVGVSLFIIGIITINLATTIFQAAVYQYTNKKPTGEFTVAIIKASFSKE